MGFFDKFRGYPGPERLSERGKTQPTHVTAEQINEMPIDAKAANRAIQYEEQRKEKLANRYARRSTGRSMLEQQPKESAPEELSYEDKVFMDLLGEKLNVHGEELDDIIAGLTLSEEATLKVAETKQDIDNLVNHVVARIESTRDAKRIAS